MKLSIMLVTMLLPVTAMGVETSGCKLIGHATGDLSIKNVCWEDVERCAPSDWTADDCAAVLKKCEARVIEQNAAIEENCVLMRCLATDDLRAYKNAGKTMGFKDGNIVYSDGTPVVIGDLTADTENVYLYYRCEEQVLLGTPSWYVFGPDADGFNMHRIED